MKRYKRSGELPQQKPCNYSLYNTYTVLLRMIEIFEAEGALPDDEIIGEHNACDRANIPPIVPRNENTLASFSISFHGKVNRAKTAVK